MVPAGSFIISQERQGESKVRKLERKEAVGKSKGVKKVIGLDGAG